jgi:hypothetical protein
MSPHHITSLINLADLTTKIGAARTLRLLTLAPNCADTRGAMYTTKFPLRASLYFSMITLINDPAVHATKTSETRQIQAAAT